MTIAYATASRGLSDRDVRRSASSHPATPLRRDTLSDRDVMVQQFGEFEVFWPSTSLRAPQVRGSVRAIAALPADWDSYGAPSIDAEVLAMAERLMLDLVEQNVDLPSLVPTSRGGVALEWHRPSMEFSLELQPTRPGLAAGSFFFSDDTSGEEWESDIDEVDMARVQRALASFRGEAR